MYIFSYATFPHAMSPTVGSSVRSGNPAKAQLLLKYVDDDFRIVQDVDGEYFVYTRPVVSRV